MSEAYARTAAEGLLRSLDHYGKSSPAVGDGRVSTPAWYVNRLGKVLASRGDSLPGDAGTWWGFRWAEYARGLLSS